MPNKAIPLYVAKQRITEHFRLTKRKPRLTIIYGAGVTTAMGENSRGAKWNDLLEEILSKIDYPGTATLDVAVTRHLSERKAVVNRLAKEGSDEMVASMFLIDRVARQIPSNWRSTLNEVLHNLENEVKKKITGATPSTTVLKWRDALELAGKLARQGKVLNVTTNFDHLVATYSKLPIFAVPNKVPSGDYSAYPEGLVIEHHELEAPSWTAEEMKQHMRTCAQSPASFRAQWLNCKNYDAALFMDHASLLHVHGSRLVPNSIIFDPAGYDSLMESQSKWNLLLEVIESSHAGITLLVGCGETVFDPHFSIYWRRSDLDTPFFQLYHVEGCDVLNIKYEQRNCSHAPQLISYGNLGDSRDVKHDEAPYHLHELLQLVESLS